MGTDMSLKESDGPYDTKAHAGTGDFRLLPLALFRRLVKMLSQRPGGRL